MTKIYLKTSQKKINHKKIGRIAGVFLSLIGTSIMVYVFLPLILWQVFLSPVFASQNVAVPIPQTTLVTPGSLKQLLISQASALSGVDYSNATNWFPSYKGVSKSPFVSSYTLTIPKIGIYDAIVSTTNTDLGKNLVNLSGTSTPPNRGKTVIFGHSTLPYLFNPKDYHTIFANAHKLQVGDDLYVTVQNVKYHYQIFSITVVAPDDTSVLSQTIDDSYLTIITCTPPGTIFARLIINSRLQKL